MLHTERNTQSLNFIQLGAVGIAIAGSILGVIGILVDIEHFFFTYLLGYTFWLEVSLGCLFLLMLHNLVNGSWGFAIRRFLEAGVRVIPLMALLFIPVLIGIGYTHEWWVSEVTTTGFGELHNYSLWLYLPFFILRAVIYFAVWGALAYFLSHWSYQNDETDNPSLFKNAQTLSAIGMILFFLTTAFASVDWLVSLNDHWYSSAFGWLSNARQVLTALAVIMVIISFFWNSQPLSRFINERTVADLGTIMLATFMTWVYLTFMQFVIIWSGNLPSKAAWYVQRTQDTWQVFVALFIILNAIAFVLMLIPGNKRNRTFVVGIAAFLILLRFLDLFWVIMPAEGQVETFTFQLWDVAPFLAIGGAWLLVFLYFLKRHRLLSINHPNLKRVLAERGEEESYEPAQQTS